MINLLASGGTAHLGCTGVIATFRLNCAMLLFVALGSRKALDSDISAIFMLWQREAPSSMLQARCCGTWLKILAA